MGVSVSLRKRTGILDFLYENRLLILTIIMVGIAIAMIGQSYAAPAAGSAGGAATGGTSSLAQPADDKTIWSVLFKVSKQGTMRLKQFYCFTAFPPLALIAAISIAFTKDEKKIAIEKKALIGMVVVFLLILAFDAVVNTVADLLTGTGYESIIPKT